MTKTITLADLKAAGAAQGVSSPKHWAFVCPICKTVQSMASLMSAGLSEDEANQAIGFNCEGRFTGAGGFDPGRATPVRGCDWSLGGLLMLHELEVIIPDSTGPRPCFELADAEAAQALEASHPFPALTTETTDVG